MPQPRSEPRIVGSVIVQILMQRCRDSVFHRGANCVDPETRPDTLAETTRTAPPNIRPVHRVGKPARAAVPASADLLNIECFQSRR